MVTIKIYFRKHNPTLTSGVVWIQFYVNREKVNFSTGVKCEEKNWNEKKCCVGNADTFCFESFGKQINQVLAVLIEYFFLK